MCASGANSSTYRPSGLPTGWEARQRQRVSCGSSNTLHIHPSALSKWRRITSLFASLLLFLGEGGWKMELFECQCNFFSSEWVSEGNSSSSSSGSVCSLTCSDGSQADVVGAPLLRFIRVALHQVQSCQHRGEGEILINTVVLYLLFPTAELMS